MNIELFLELCESRYSCRNYSKKEVPDRVIKKCIEAARLAPSACNKQPWKFIIIKDREVRGKLYREAILPGIKMPWIEDAPVIVALCAERSFLTHKVAPKISSIDYIPIDIGIAGEHFILAAKAQRVDSCWIGWFNKKVVKRILKIPKKIDLLSLITIGYSKDNDKKQPNKKKIEKITYYDIWGNNTKIRE